MNVSDFIVQRLVEWQVRQVFGYPGDGINGLLGALNRGKDQVRFIQTRHEEMAAFMACAHAKFTGETGVCVATSGPGAIHLLNGLYDAKLDHQPVVAIIGQQRRSSLGSSYQQEVDLASLYKDVASDYLQVVVHPAQARQVIDRAFRIAHMERTVTAVIIPVDVQEEKAVEEPPRKHGSVFTGVGYSAARVIPADDELQRAADVLNAGEKVAILVGAGAFSAVEEIKVVAGLLGAGVAKALLGKAVLPDDLPYVTGSIGLLGTKPSWDMMENCDTLLMIGSSFPYTEYLPQPGQARGVQIDIDGKMLSIRYPMEVNLLGDSKSTLQGLIPLLTHKTDRSWQDGIAKGINEWWDTVEQRARLEADPINPQLVLQELSPRLPDYSIITADSGTSAFWFARNIRIREGMLASLSGNLATMCPAVPYAVAAKFAYPDKPAFAIVGDGAMQMLGMNELITISKYWQEWASPTLVIIVLNNRDLNMVTWEQRMEGGEPKFEDSQSIPDVNYAAFAHSLGLGGIRVETAAGVVPALEQALSADRPVVLDVVVDPNVPILPAHVTMEQFAKYNKALLKGDPDAMSLIRQTIRQVMTGGIG
ncbi:thiamine pyrophosphate-requiring protein [Dyadobacter sandarakinus]|uniref:Thiamine pyrophosphate-requiring protein n=1 Tax=Dyadobacter sandarakinus TaxID=2747268 RepID=A0ABX7I7I6_9BACT|nr:thiamine pyrophosphate-requiring protein [Dyadobacter sandarakinus]QRR01143.1 thiamine pyrophosphate-requiring protein [Dyadobacter sandarakinus]